MDAYVMLPNRPAGTPFSPCQSSSYTSSKSKKRLGLVLGAILVVGVVAVCAALVASASNNEQKEHASVSLLAAQNDACAISCQHLGQPDSTCSTCINCLRGWTGKLCEVWDEMVPYEEKEALLKALAAGVDNLKQRAGAVIPGAGRGVDPFTRQLKLPVVALTTHSATLFATSVGDSWVVPDQYAVKSMEGQSSSRVNVFANIREYAAKANDVLLLQERQSGSGFSFAATFADMFRNNQHMTVAETQQFVYQLSASDLLQSSLLDVGAEMALAYLPTRYDTAELKRLYGVFLDLFGSHYVTGGQFGGSMQAYENTCMEHAKFDVDTLQANAAADLRCWLGEQDQCHTLRPDFSSRRIRKRFVFRGGLPEHSDVSQWQSWIATLPHAPSPIQLTYEPITSLVRDPSHKAVLDMAVQDLQSRRLADEEQQLQQLPAVGRCFSPNLGGFYQVDDCRSVDHVVNYYTGGLYCPTNYNAYSYGRILSPETKCGAVQYVCLRSMIDPENTFGGIYQIGDRDGIGHRANPMTGGLSCPAGYQELDVGRVIAPEPRYYGVRQMVCHGSVPPSVLQDYGGMYQLADRGVGCDGVDDRANPMTGGLSCPADFVPVTRGRIKIPEGRQCGGIQVWCMRNGMVIPKS
eukprot:GILK01010995.1.p1 GENE.GILK01010995.1~~GILK01010995.1.p1  ORF type:complete len:643 (+),score=91.46 GILK01010995.1:27-1931(+)